MSYADMYSSCESCGDDINPHMSLCWHCETSDMYEEDPPHIEDGKPELWENWKPR